MFFIQVLGKQRKSATSLLTAYSISSKNLKLHVQVIREQSEELI